MAFAFDILDGGNWAFCAFRACLSFSVSAHFTTKGTLEPWEKRSRHVRVYFTNHEVAEEREITNTNVHDIVQDSNFQPLYFVFLTQNVANKLDNSCFCKPGAITCMRDQECSDQIGQQNPPHMWAKQFLHSTMVIWSGYTKILLHVLKPSSSLTFFMHCKWFWIWLKRTAIALSPYVFTNLYFVLPI